eukprot:gnl/Dysnectes_brevis/5801_a8583_296.p1 GENE.gnl/Dysnectes_brevis/5801_a8583_296~~gnl/Dysnectes_brevis/5801_a8583_296.p1  ORF type:complete len:361 (+),score=96.85 gnl/Dysnectes_brevis/5801_a8583_296:259-1341(+)
MRSELSNDAVSPTKEQLMSEFIRTIDKREPFEHAKHINPTPFLSVYEVTKTLLVAFTIFPLRLILLGITVVSHWIFARICAFRVDLSIQDRDPMSPRRRRVFSAVNPVFCRMFLFSYGFHRLHVHGPAPPASRPIVLNHVSFLDLYVLMAAGRHDFLVMSEVLDFPFIGYVFRASNSVFVDREDRTSCVAAAEMLHRRNVSPDLPAVRPLTVFPEGTITNQTSVIRFKSGAFRPLRPVTPAALVYPHRHFNPSNDDMLFGLHLFRCLTQVYNSVTLTYLPATRPQPADSPRTYADRVQHLVADACGLPASPATLEETTAWLAHRHGGLALESALEVVVSRVARHYSVAIPQWDIEECQQR